MQRVFCIVCLVALGGCSGRAEESPSKPLPVIPGALAIVATKDSRLPSTTLFLAKGGMYQDRTKLAADADAHSIAWAPDGKRISFVEVYDLGIHIADVERGTVESLPNGRYWSKPRPVWSPQGDKLAAVVLDASPGPGILSITKNTFTKFPGCKQPCSFMAWSPDGRWIALVCGGDVMLADPNGGVPITLCTLPRQEQLAWSPDSKKLVISGFPTLSVVDPDSREVRAIPVPEGDYTRPSWSPDGKWLAFGYTDLRLSAPVLIYVARPDGTEFKQVSKPNRGFGRYSHTDPCWSPDSKFIVFHSSRGSGDMTGVSTPDNALYIASIDGLHYTGISPKEVEDLGAVWSPK
jgi:Tol biopolymer transport system component